MMNSFFSRILEGAAPPLPADDNTLVLVAPVGVVRRRTLVCLIFVTAGTAIPDVCLRGGTWLRSAYDRALL
jgi:hypothetical protein